MSQAKGLKRLAFFIIFLIPVAWYLFIQTFGSNTFVLELQSSIDEDCGNNQGIIVVSKMDSLNLTESNYMNRVTFGANKRKIVFEKRDKNFFNCVDQSDADLVLISEEGLWGSYDLTRAGVDQLLTEIDILIIQKSYGKGARR